MNGDREYFAAAGVVIRKIREPEVMKQWWLHLSGCGRVVVVLISIPVAVGSSVLAQRPSPVGSPAATLMDPRRDSGMNVAPVFEGWAPNPDGTVNLYFGYMNRNWKEELDIPIGPNNLFEPAPADRGQPTHFMPRRHKQVFAITVPKEFRGEFVWKLTIRGKTESVPGAIKPEQQQQIDVHSDTQTGNLPPKVRVGPDQTIGLRQAATLAVAVIDDGLPKPRPQDPPQARLNVSWSKYRGPGAVMFEDHTPDIKDNEAVTRATFSEPGTYWLEVVADDGSIFRSAQGEQVPGYACCWTRAIVKVNVTPDSEPVGQ